MSDAGTDEFLDARPSEDEEAHSDAGAGGDDEPMFSDENAPDAAPAEAEAEEEPDDGSADAGFIDAATAADAAEPLPAPAPAPAITDSQRLRRAAADSPATRSSQVTRLPADSPATRSSQVTRLPSDSQRARRPDSGVGPSPSDSQRARRPSESQVTRPPSESGRTARPGSDPPGRPPSGVSRPPSGPSSSQRLKALPAAGSSGAHAALGGSSTSKAPRPALRAERTRADDEASIGALEARVTTAPGGDPYLGRDVGPFRVDRFLEIDRGERRYIGIMADTQRVVLLRIFPLSGTYGDEFKRLADRAERAVKVESPHIDAAVAAGRTKDCFYAGFEPPFGQTLREVLAAEGPLAEPDAVVLLDQLSKALGAIHAREVAHAHLSPATVRRLRPGVWLVEAPGLTRPRPALAFMAAGGDVLGVPGYIAPEAVDAGEYSKAADLYAAGCVVWTALVGRPPFQGDDEVQVLLDQLNQQVPALAPALPEGRLVSEATQTIVQKLTGYTPDVRYRDVHDLINDLRLREKGDKITPLVASVKPEDFKPKAKLRGAAVSIVVLAFLNAVLLTLVVTTVLKAFAIPLDDPTTGLELPLPKAAPAPGATEPPPGR